MAKRILTLDAEITENTNQIGELVEASPAAALVEETGIGPVTAATVLVAWSQPWTGLVPTLDGSGTRLRSPL